MASRGSHLVRADRRFATGAGVVGRIAAPAFAAVLNRLDERLELGGIDVTLPDGSHRRIGFRSPGPVAIVRLHNWMPLVRLATSGSVGWYKAWAAGEWSSPDPVPLFELFMANAVALGDVARAKGPMRWINSLAHRLRDNGLARARENIAAHYDLGNDFYAAWLDPGMTYSSGRFTPLPPEREGKSAKREGEGLSRGDRTGPPPLAVGESTPPAPAGGGLEAAQHRKNEMLLDRLDLKPGQRLLEIGCGWGTLAIAAAKRGVDVVGLTLSVEQKSWADDKIAGAGLSNRCSIRLEDYRVVDEQFDAIASVEMVEAVGERWWPAYLDCLHRNLRPGGKAALQFISIDHRLFDAYSSSADFIQAYIFPGGMLLNEPRFQALAQDRGLSWSDRDGFALDYADTLALWRSQYDQAVTAGRLSEFDDEFHNLWRYYLMYCEGGFRGRGIDVAQVTLSRS